MFSIRSRPLLFYGLVLEFFYLALGGFYFWKIKLGDIEIPFREVELLKLFFLFALGLLTVYILIYLLFQKNPQIQINLKFILIFTVIFGLTLAVLPPLGSADLFSYASYTRIWLEYKANPYLTFCSDFPEDSLCNQVALEWNDSPPFYGPPWLYFSVIPHFLAGDNVYFNLFLLKILALLFHLGAAVLIYKILAIRGSSWKNFATLFWAWNPLVLFESVNNGHNDIMLVFLILLAFYFYLQKRKNLVIPVLILAALVKYIALLLVPIVFLFLLGTVQTVRKKFIFIFQNFISNVVLIFLLFLPFWPGWIYLETFLERFSFYSLSALAPLIALVFAINLTGTEAIISLLQAQTVGLFIFFLAYLSIIATRLWDKNFDRLLQICFWIFFIYITTASFLIFPWYLIWLIFLAVLIVQSGMYRIVIFLTITGLAYYFIAPFITFTAVIILMMSIYFFSELVWLPLFQGLTFWSKK